MKSDATPRSGLTLVEMLVALVIVSTVTALMWQALALTTRWEQGVLRARQEGGEQRLRRAWVEQALWAVVTGAEGDALRFNGGAQQLRTYTSAPPWPGTLGPDAMELLIERDPGDAGQWQLRVRRLADDQRWTLMLWRGETARFDYLAHDGRWQTRWPVPQAEPLSPAQVQRELPLAVRVTGPQPAVLVHLAATRNPMLRRADVVFEPVTR